MFTGQLERFTPLDDQPGTSRDFFKSKEVGFKQLEVALAFQEASNSLAVHTSLDDRCGTTLGMNRAGEGMVL